MLLDNTDLLKKSYPATMAFVKFTRQVLYIIKETYRKRMKRRPEIFSLLRKDFEPFPVNEGEDVSYQKL